MKGVLSTPDKTAPIIEKVGDHAIISLMHNEQIVKLRFTKEHLKFIRDIEILTPASVAGTEVYAFGQALQTKSKQWELLGRALLPVEMKK